MTDTVPVQPIMTSTYNSGFDQSADVVRLHLNENPYGAWPPVVDLAQELGDVNRYPDSDCSELRAKLARVLGLEDDMVIVTNGIDELVLLAALAFVGAGGRAVTTASTFPGYRTALAVVRARLTEVALQDDRIHVPSLLAELRKGGADAVIVCNPHNPTGTVLSARDRQRLVSAAKDVAGVLLFDEAYAEFVAPDRMCKGEHALQGSPVVCMRTFSKAYGLAGLRVGYGVGPPNLIERLRRTRNSVPFSVNRLAQIAALRAIDSGPYIQSVRERNAEVRSAFCRRLDRLRVEYVPSEANFVLVRTGGDSGAVARYLLQRGRILVRDLEPFGLPGSIRVSIGTHEQLENLCTVLVSAIEEVCRDGEASSLHARRP